MTLAQTYDRLREKRPKYSLPITHLYFNTALKPFGPYRNTSNQWKFRLGLGIEIPKTQGFDPPKLFAIKSGTIFYEAGQGSSSPGQLKLLPADFLGWSVFFEIGSLPRWFPIEKATRYRNVPASAAKNAATRLLERQGETERSIKKLRSQLEEEPIRERFDRYISKFGKNQGLLREEIISIWLKSKWQDASDESYPVDLGLTVIGGDELCEMGSSDTAEGWATELRMEAPFEDTDTHYLNPAYYFALWDEMGWVSVPSWLLEMSQTDGPPIGTGVLKLINQSGSDTPPFDTLAKASRTIMGAVAEASAGDTLLITDQGIYKEEVLIDTPIALTSTSLQSALDEPADYPTIDGEGKQRPVTFRRIASGISHIGKVKIHNGRGAGERQDGGGILIERTDNVIVSSCVVTKCQAHGANNTLGPAFFAEGCGGGIAIYHSSAGVLGSLIKKNRANDRGSGIGVYGYGWPTVARCDVLNNHSIDAWGYGRPDGGGIGITISVPRTELWSEMIGAARETLQAYFDRTSIARARDNFVRLVGCNIKSNGAHDDGGGVYTSVASTLFLRNCTLEANKAHEDGGGLRATMGSSVILDGCRIVNLNESNFEKDVDIEAGGGGISCRNVSLLKLRNTQIRGNIANGWAGGGVYFISSDEGEFTGGFDFDWNHILIDVFGFEQAHLVVDEESVVRSNRATFLDGQDSDHGKGGGIYALRWKGDRNDDDVEPREIAGQPLRVDIEESARIRENQANFSGADQLHLEDMVQQTTGSNTIRNDDDLPGNGRFSYP